VANGSSALNEPRLLDQTVLTAAAPGGILTLIVGFVKYRVDEYRVPIK